MIRATSFKAKYVTVSQVFLQLVVAQEFHSYIKNANQLIENLTDDGDLETCDGQLLLTTSILLENLVNSNLAIYNTVTAKRN